MENLSSATSNNGVATTSAAQISSRQGRSPLRFARLRQTRVASISPTPTLVSSTTVNGNARSGQSPSGRVRGTSGSRGPTSRRRDASTRRFSITTATDEKDALAEAKADAVNAHLKPTGGQATDLEKGISPDPAAAARPSPAPPPAATAGPRKSAVERLLPHPIPHFLGHRRPARLLAPHLRDVKPFASIIPSVVHRIPPPLEAILWALIGAFVGIAIVLLTFGRPRHFTSSTDVSPHAWAAPIIIGSFGASSVLLYAAPASPLGQPRCFVGGQTLSALAGVIITKLLKLAGPVSYDLQRTDTSQSVVWISGALATACALVVMIITGTLHPPGGATAVLCATNAEVSRMGWKIIPVVLLSSVLMLAWSLIWMNLGRKRYPESFVAAAPVAYKDGNLLQGLVDWVKKRRTQAENNRDASKSSHIAPSPVASQPSRTTSNSPPLPTTASRATAAAATLPKPTDGTRNANDPWLDETDWRRANHTVAEEPQEDLPVERPSRWECATARTTYP